MVSRVEVKGAPGRFPCDVLRPTVLPLRPDSGFYLFLSLALMASLITFRFVKRHGTAESRRLHGELSEIIRQIRGAA